MQKAPHSQPDIAFPKKYLQKFEKHRKRQSDLLAKPKLRKPSRPAQIFSSNCKQAISLAKTKVYCCVLKEMLQGSTCKACPYHEPEPLEYTLFKRE